MGSVFSGDEAIHDVSPALVGSAFYRVVDPCLERPENQNFPMIRKGESTYRALKKNTSQVATGRNGKKNCLVTGMSSKSMSNEAAPVFIIGPGAWLMESENIASMINIKYCPS